MRELQNVYGKYRRTSRTSQRLWRYTGVCAMVEEKRSLPGRLFTLAWEGIFQAIVIAAAAAFVTWLSQRKMQSAIAHPAEYWLGTSSIFFGSVAAMLLLEKLRRRIAAVAAKWFRPPKLTIIAHGGHTATVELRHSGVPVTWIAKRRIVEMTGTQHAPNPPNPDPLQRAFCLKRDGRSYRWLHFTDGETASIVLAEIKYSHPASSFRETWVVIPNPDEEWDTRVSGETTIELEIETMPLQKKFSIKRRYKIQRAGNDIMECIESRIA